MKKLTKRKMIKHLKGDVKQMKLLKKAIDGEIKEDTKLIKQLER